MSYGVNLVNVVTPKDEVPYLCDVR